MLEEVKGEIREYLRQNMGIYIFITGLFVVGVCTGVALVFLLDAEVMNELDESFNMYVESGYPGEINQAGVLGEALRHNLAQAVVIWLSGMLAFGFPIPAAIICFRGVTAGFAVAFLIEKAGYYGALLALGTVLPHNLLLIPAFLVISVTGFSLALLNFKERYLYKRSFNLKSYLSSYCLLMLLMLLVVVAGCLVEAYISVVFARLIMPVMT